ncbi:MAG: HAD hydrolase-like protein [Pseudomonadota bacterium]
MTIRHWIFDFDGTLVDSAPAILDAFAAALTETGLPPHVALDNRLIGPPLAETLARISGSNEPALIQSLTEHFKIHYDRDGVVNTAAYSGVEPLLQQLLADGITLHIATNKRLSATRAIIEHLGWQRHFSSIYALDMVEPRLPGKAALLQKQLAELVLPAKNARYIGDKTEDGDAASANGLRFHYAAWGYGDLTTDTLPNEWHWLAQPLDLLAEELRS